jgi:hypothetical protein
MGREFRAALDRQIKEILKLGDDLASKPEEDQKHFVAFLEDFFLTMELYVLKNYGTKEGTNGYGNSWIKDGLDNRALFSEMNAKFHRLKRMMWGGQENPNAYFESDPVKMYKEMRDISLYTTFMMRRLDVERGPITRGAIRKSERDDI